MKYANIAAVFCVFVLAGCVTQYQERTFSGGYSDIQLNENTYRVNVRGNGFTSVSRANDIALLRAAELTLQHGGERFVILSGGISQEVSGARSILASPVAIAVNGQDFSGTSGNLPTVRPAGDLVIQIVMPSDPRFQSALDARLIQSQLRPQLVP